MQNIELFSFFSGIGFLDLGFAMAGFPIEFVNEFSPVYLDCYKYARRNMSNYCPPKYGYHCCDAESFLDDNTWKQTVVDLPANTLRGFIGGPPCPDFSVAGQNKGATGKNGRLTKIYVDLIIKRKPDFFVFENVKGLYSTQKHREFYLELKQMLSNAGYILSDSIENAIEYGTPQNRERLLLVGISNSLARKKGPFQFGNSKKYSAKEIAKINWPRESPFQCNSPCIKPEGIIEALTVEYWFRKNDVTNHENAHDVFKIKNINRYYTIKEGHTSGKSFKRLHRWRYSPTAAYGNNEVHLHPYKPRRLSVAEALAIQSVPAFVSLPDSISLSAKFKTIANGVPYLLAYGLACDISDYLRNE